MHPFFGVFRYTNFMMLVLPLCMQLALTNIPLSWMGAINLVCGYTFIVTLCLFTEFLTVFLSPEKAVSQPWRGIFSSDLQLALVAIDEAHCVYEWLVFDP